VFSNLKESELTQTAKIDDFGNSFMLQGFCGDRPLSNRRFHFFQQVVIPYSEIVELGGFERASIIKSKMESPNSVSPKNTK
jgi:hypothetical protein